MMDLFKAELLRFRVWTIALAAVNLLVLGFQTRLVDLAQQPLPVYQVYGLVYVILGLLLGLYQMGSYRRPNHWLNLLHRPMPQWQVAAALLGAAAVLLAVAVVLPILIVAGWQEVMTARVVDLRHWLLALSAMLLTLCGYMAGAYGILGGRRYAWSGVVLLILLLFSGTTGAMALALQTLMLAWLVALVVIAFKPDLSAPPQRAPAVVATALPLQMGLYGLLLLLGIAFELVWIMLGTHPLNAPTPPSGGYIEAERAEGRDLLIAGLAASHDPNAPLWREQVALSEVAQLDGGLMKLPARNELTNLAPMEFDDGQQRVRWVFSHDSMRFTGYSLADHRASGGFGVGASNVEFPSPPLPLGAMSPLPGDDNILLGHRTLYHYSSQTGLAMPRIQLSAGEAFAGTPGMIGENLAVISNRALYFFDGRDVLENDLVMAPRLRVPVPGNVANLGRTDLIELVDGYLISFTYADRVRNEVVAPYQQLLHVHDDGQVDAVARRELRADFPDIYSYRGWWLSPPLYTLNHAVGRWFGNAADPVHAIARPPLPRSVIVLAGALALLSVLGATWLTRGAAWSLPRRLAWIAACGVIGLPALLSLWLLYPERERSDVLSAALSGVQPATA
ncbi:MAG: hypothetical protein ACREPV_09100 [Lysobacter sp.]